MAQDQGHRDEDGRGHAAIEGETLIVGAGLAGASVAAAFGGRPRVVEQGPQPCAEASGQNAGMVRLLVDDPVERNLSLRAAARLAELDRTWATPPSRVTGAVLALAHEPTALDDGAAHLRARGVPVERLDDPGAVAPALRGAALSRAWWLPTARVADPAALVDGLLRQAGARLHLSCPVTALLVQGGRVTGVQTPTGPLGADRVVLACGAWGSRLVAPLGLRRPLHPVRRSLHHSAPHPLARADHPWCWLEDQGLYLKPEGGGWLVSGCDEALSPAPPGPGSTGPEQPGALDRATARVLALLPALQDLAWRRGWSGLRTFAPDRRPLLGPDPELPGLVWAAGLGGFGLSSALAIGEVVAALCAGSPPAWLRPGDVDPGRTFPRRWVLHPEGTPLRSRLVDG